MAKLLLECNDISYSYHTLQGEIPVIEHMSFQIREGEFVSIVGPSGCGKSTLLNLLTGLIEPESGSITLYYTDEKEKEMQYTYYGYMPQQDQLFEWSSIEKNVTLALRINHVLTEERMKHVDQLLKRYGLIDYKKKKPSELSGGMRQRAALIRTLAMEPRLLYLDEPFSALDYQNRLRSADDIGKIIQNEKKTAILVTHDISEAISLSDRILVLSPKPTKVIKEILLPYRKEQLSPMEVRSKKDFSVYFERVWKELNQ